MSNIFSSKIEQLYSEIFNLELGSLPLCAAESVVSPFCKLPLNSFVQEKYIMGGILEYSKNNNFIGSVELYKIYQLIDEQCNHLFQSNYADARTLSGINAVMSLLMSLFKSGDTILITSEDCGGHGSMEKICHRLGLKTQLIPYNYPDYDFNYDDLNEILNTQKIDGILIALSDIIFMPQLHKINLPKETCLIFDATQILGFIGSNTIENPLNWFEDTDKFILMGATHKTLSGPTSGLIMTKNNTLASKFDNIISPDYLRNTQLHQKLCLSLALLELQEFGNEFMKDILENTNTLALALESKGFHIAKKGEVFSNTHQLFLYMDKTSCEQFYKKSALYNISLNARYKKIYNYSGIRIGLQAVTRYGWKRDEMIQIADIISNIFNERSDISLLNPVIQQQIEQLTTNKEIGYTFNEESFTSMQNIFK